MGNSNSNLTKNEKDLYLREIKRLTDHNNNLQGTNINNSKFNPLNYTDRQKLDIQNKLTISNMQKEIALNQSEINRLRTNHTNNYNSNYSKITSQCVQTQKNNNTNNNVLNNPRLLTQLVQNNNANLTPQERQQVMNYIQTLPNNNNQLTENTQSIQHYNGNMNNHNGGNMNDHNGSNNNGNMNNYNMNNNGNNNNSNMNNYNMNNNGNNMNHHNGNNMNHHNGNNMNNHNGNNMNHHNGNNMNNHNNNGNNNGNFMHQNMGTQDMYKSKEIMSVNLDNSIETLSKSYYNEEEAARIQFKINENKRQQEFDESQKKRKIEFNSKLKDFESGPINAQKLFGLPDGYTLEILNKAYKKLAIRTHPDRPGGSNDKFRTVTKAYMLLMDKYKEKEQDKTYYDLKSNADNFYKKQDENRDRVGKLDKDRFNVKLFNKIYEDNRLYEPNDEGYGNWFQSEENTYNQPKIFSDKFNINIFNTVFDQIKETHGEAKTQIENIKDPTALMSKSNNINFTELGGGDINNFGKPTIERKDLNFSDLREAYTKTHLINPNEGSFRKDYQNIDELKKDRANISFTPDKTELRRQEMERVIQRESEDKRQRRLKTYDGVVEQHYTKVHKQLLGFNPDVEHQLTYNN
jgi:curved DNA-binding protein CbpA